MTLATLRADTARACVHLAQQLGALQNAYFDHAQDGFSRAPEMAFFPLWDAGKVHGALGITANTLSAMAVLLGLDYREAYGLPQGPTGIEVEAARRILAEHDATGQNAKEPAGGTISAPATPDSTPTQEVAAAGSWDAQEVAYQAEVALMEHPGTCAERVGAAMEIIRESLPREVDAGVGYDNSRRKVDVLLLLLAVPWIKVAYSETRKRLEQALEQARYVGD